MPLQIRRGTTAERLSITPLVGEPVFDTTLGQIFVGDGTTAGGTSPNIDAQTIEQALDTVGAALVNGVHQNISFVYGTAQDAANRIDANVSVSTLLENLDLNGFDIVGHGNINITGSITGNIKGSIFADDSTLLVDGTNGTIPWSVISDAPAFLTEVTGSITGDVTGSVFADDSTMLVDGTNGRIVGPVFANVTGNVIGNITGDVTGNITGNVVGDVTGSVFADNSTLLVDATNGTIPWSVISDVPAFLTEVPESLTADVTGSVFSDTSVMLVDGTNGQIVGDINASLGANLTLNGFDVVGTGDININGELTANNIISPIIETDSTNTIFFNEGNIASNPMSLIMLGENKRPHFKLRRKNDAASLAASNTTYGRISFERDDINGNAIATSYLSGGSDFLDFAVDDGTTTFPASGSIYIKNQSIGLGTRTPSANVQVDIAGIMKLVTLTVAPLTAETGMIAVADGNTTGWDPKGTNSGVPYPVFYNGSSWAAMTA